MNEAYVGIQWMHDRLTTDATIQSFVSDRIYESIVPAGTAFPYIVYSFVAGRDVMAIGAIRVWSNMLFQVMAQTDTNDLGVIAPVTKRVDELLHGTSGQFGATAVWSSVREQPVLMPPDIRAGELIYRRGGGEYRLHVQPV